MIGKARRSCCCIPALVVLLLTSLSVYYSTQISVEIIGKGRDSYNNVPIVALFTSHTSHVESIWQQTTRLIYANSPNLQRWLDDDPLWVYIYDTLDYEVSLDYVSQCIERRFARNNTPMKCGHFPRICNSTDSGMLGKFHNNYNSDVVTIQRFRDYPFQTKDPHKADLFLVPYPHKSHCLCHQTDFSKTRCKFNFQWIRTNVLDRLLYYNDTTKANHLFILGSDYEQSNPPFRREISLDVSLGPANGCRPNRHNLQGKAWNELCGSFTMPYINTMAHAQPNIVAELIGNVGWMNRPRQYSVAAIFGTPKHLAIRTEFVTNHTTLFQNDVGGLPLYIHDIGVSRLPVNPMEIYYNSTFCPILMGDECSQKRFFDVILAGCIPVVLEFEGDEEGWSSWFNHKRCSMRRTYPFAQGIYFNDTRAGVEYSSFVVVVNGTCGLPCVKPVLERIMKDDDQLRGIRNSMRKYALLFTVGLDPQHYSKHPDAFSALLVTLRHYVRHLASIPQELIR